MRNRRHRRSYNEPGHAHELTFSTYKGYKFLSRDRTRHWLIESINEARESLGFDVWAYVIMPEHVHLIVHPWTSEYEISKIIGRIKEPVGRRAIEYIQSTSPEWLDRITRNRGRRVERLFWQTGGGYDRNITRGSTLLKMVDYIHMNPVRRGLVDQVADWRWSSAAWYEGAIDVPMEIDAIPPDWLEDL